MSIVKTTLIAASLALVATSAFAAQNHRARAAADARAAYAAATTWTGSHPGNLASDTSREGLVQTSQ